MTPPPDNRRLHHKVPCAECPWRKASAPGWLGGYTAEDYADDVQSNLLPSCHLRDHGPETPETALCVGSAHTSANACIMPYGDAQREAVAQVGQNADCFRNPGEFYAHHTDGQQYVTPLMRRLMGADNA